MKILRRRESKFKKRRILFFKDNLENNTTIKSFFRNISNIVNLY